MRKVYSHREPINWPATIDPVKEQRRQSPNQVRYTGDGRYLVVNGVLWRASNPELNAAKRDQLVKELMQARRAVQVAREQEDAWLEQIARDRVHACKLALGERGDVWWADNSRDWTRTKVENSPYAGQPLFNKRPVISKEN